MDDLKMLREAWGEPSPPSPAAHQAARAALMGRIASPDAPPAAQPRRRSLSLGWLLGGVTAAAAVAAVAFSVLPDAVPLPGSSDDVGVPGRDLLLAAAGVAESQPDGSGTYWHVKTVFHLDGAPFTEEYWNTHDGGRYQPSGSGVTGPWAAGSGFPVAADNLTLAELQQLPTDSTALTAWITDSVAEWGRPDVAGDAAHELTRMLWRVPTPPAVRAAAFRALADLSNVTRLEDQDGNWVLRIAFAVVPPADKFGGTLPEGVDGLTVVIDPATSQLVSITNFQGTMEILVAEWTDDLPPVVGSPAPPTDSPTGPPPTVTT